MIVECLTTSVVCHVVCNTNYYAYHKWLSAVVQHSDVDSRLLLQMIQTCWDITSCTLSSQHKHFLWGGTWKHCKIYFESGNYLKENSFLLTAYNQNFRFFISSDHIMTNVFGLKDLQHQGENKKEDPACPWKKARFPTIQLL